MNIGDEIWVHGFVDEIRTAERITVIVKNKGGYFGTTIGEVMLKPDGDAQYRNGYECGKIDGRAEAYQKGLAEGKETGREEVWTAARKICADSTLSVAALAEIFGKGKTIDDIMLEHTASEAIEKIKAYEEQKDEIKVGDEIIYTCCDGMVKFVVCEIGDDRYEGMRTTVSNNWGRWTWVKKKAKGLKKTGRHFDAVEQLLKELGE